VLSRFDFAFANDNQCVRADIARHTKQIFDGFTLSRKSQGRGLATEAVRGAIYLIFERTPALRVHAVTDARNLPCIRLLERIGMH
jgi:RimJ/RimL family protein N-acetyltransferase